MRDVRAIVQKAAVRECERLWLGPHPFPLSAIYDERGWFDVDARSRARRQRRIIEPHVLAHRHRRGTP